MLRLRFTTVPRERKAADHRRRGEVMIEFALVFLMFFALLMTIMEVGRSMWAYSSIATATRRAGDYLMVHGSKDLPNKSRVEDIVELYTAGLEEDDLAVAINWLDGDDLTSYTDASKVERNDFAQVRVTYQFRFILTSLIYAGTGYPMRSTTRVVVAN